MVAQLRNVAADVEGGDELVGIAGGAGQCDGGCARGLRGVVIGLVHRQAGGADQSGQSLGCGDGGGSWQIERVAQPSPSFGEVAALEPVRPQATGEPHRSRRVRAVAEPLHCGAQVVVFGVQPGRRLGCVGPRQACGDGLGDRDEMFGVALADDVELVVVLQLLDPELTDRLEHRHAGCVVIVGGRVHADQVAVDEDGQLVEHRGAGGAGVSADRVGGVERAAAGEHAQPP